MTDNTSATGGFLNITPDPDQVGLENALHDLIAGITELPPTMVRPRYQPDPPKQPPKETDWCAFGISDAENEATQLLPGEEGSRLHTEDLLTVLVSFYGPGAWNLARRLGRGLDIPQNRDVLRRRGLALAWAGRPAIAPDFVGGAWISRVDLPLTIRQGETGDVAVLSLKSAPTSITGEIHHD